MVQKYQDQLTAFLVAQVKLNGLLGVNGTNKVSCWTVRKMLEQWRGVYSSFMTYEPCLQDSMVTFILERDVELEQGLNETLESLMAIDLLEIFERENIESNELKDLDLNDLIHLGVTLERAQKFLNNRQNEDERKKKLEKMLQDVDCAELYGCLVGKGYTAETVLSINYDILKEIGLSFQERKKVLKKINDEKSKLGNVSRIISKLVQMFPILYLILQVHKSKLLFFYFIHFRYFEWR